MVTKEDKINNSEQKEINPSEPETSAQSKDKDLHVDQNKRKQPEPEEPAKFKSYRAGG